MKWKVFNEKGKLIGHAENMAECKKVHKEYYLKTDFKLLKRYAGLQTNNELLKAKIAYPEFYAIEMFT